MTLAIDCAWESAPGVRAPELRATWARLRITVGDQTATLVKERETPAQVRESIDVAAYPLAEWLAINWWALDTRSHLPDYEGLNLAGAGDGFPWPTMVLRSDRQQMWVRVTPRQDQGLRVHSLASINAVLDGDEVLRSLGRFIDATVRRLDESGVTGTLLQDEWSAIQEADAEVRQFAMVAASWGFDPYDISDDVAHALLSAGEALNDNALLADLARAVPFSALESAENWLRDAIRAKRSADARVRPLPAFEPLLSVSGAAPWREGYRRADALREELGLSLTDPVPIEDFVALSHASSQPPENVEALARVDGDETAAIVGPDIDPSAPRGRFIGARALARRITDPRTRSSLLTRGARYTDKLERAFAAEFLAPAAGLRELLDGDFSEESQARAARAFRVSDLVIGHQIDNQLAA
ncbi:ImmA/IrrE family metallo-endopeptidase [Salana multivorans]|nr:hypothetical protein [Salana multivorans]